MYSEVSLISTCEEQWLISALACFLPKFGEKSGPLISDINRCAPTSRLRHNLEYEVVTKKPNAKRRKYGESY